MSCALIAIANVYFMCKRSAFEYVLADWTAIQHIALRAAGFGGNWKMVTSLHDTDAHRSKMAARVFGPLSHCFRSSVSIPAKLFRGTNCFCSAFPVQQCKLKPDSAQHFFQSIAFAGTAKVGTGMSVQLKEA